MPYRPDTLVWMGEFCFGVLKMMPKENVSSVNVLKEALFVACFSFSCISPGAFSKHKVSKKTERTI